MISSTLQTQENKNITAINNERLRKMATEFKLHCKTDMKGEKKEGGEF